MKRAIDYAGLSYLAQIKDPEQNIDTLWESLEPCLVYSEIEKVLDGLTICLEGDGFKQAMDVQYNAAIADIKEAIKKEINHE